MLRLEFPFSIHGITKIIRLHQTTKTQGAPEWFMSNFRYTEGKGEMPMGMNIGLKQSLRVPFFLVVLSALISSHADGGNLVATDETIGTQWFQIPNWDMTQYQVAENRGYGDFSFYHYPSFLCAKEISISAEILSDPQTNGQPFLESFTRLNTYKEAKNGHGGAIDARCFTDNPDYISFRLEQQWNLPTLSFAPLFVNAGAINYGATFSSTSAPRGWIKVEYLK